MSTCDLTFLVILLCTFVCQLTRGSSVQLQSHNLEDVLNHNELVLVNFYADWCRFSQILKPIFDDTAKKLAEEFPGTGKVALGKVDCDRETGIAQKFQVTKYPTLKLFRNGQLIKREYRGQRSVESISSFLRDQLKDPMLRVEDVNDLEEVDKKKRHVIGYFGEESGPDFENFSKMARMLKDDCQFHLVTGKASEKERVSGNKMVFRPAGEYATDNVYQGSIADYPNTLHWATDKCVPLVREITFENAEELTEEGLPFLILFHNVDDTETPETFKRVVSTQLLTEKNSVNFLTADGSKFTHPLYHLGKTSKDLPVLAIDSFRHMYLWKHDARVEMEKSGLLLQFVKDLLSGKLHREFHHGPENPPATEAPDGNQNNSDTPVAAPGHHDKVAHFNVQQQVIVGDNGVRMQIVRFVQVGAQQPVDLRPHLEQAALEVPGLHGNDKHDEQKMNPELDMINKVVADFFGGVLGDKDGPPGVGVGSFQDGFYQAMEAERQKKPEDAAEKTPSDDGQMEQKPEDIQAVNPKVRIHHLPGHKGTGDEQEPEGRQEHPSSQDQGDTASKDGETTTKSYTRISQMTVKLNVDPLPTKDSQQQRSSPPESIFRKLAPSNTRYTILKEEL